MQIGMSGLGHLAEIVQLQEGLWWGLGILCQCCRWWLVNVAVRRCNWMDVQLVLWVLNVCLRWVQFETMNNEVNEQKYDWLCRSLWIFAPAMVQEHQRFRDMVTKETVCTYLFRRAVRSGSSADWYRLRLALFESFRVLFHFRCLLCFWYAWRWSGRLDNPMPISIRSIWSISDHEITHLFKIYTCYLRNRRVFAITLVGRPSSCILWLK